MAKRWYIVHVYSGFESKVRATLKEKINSSSNADKFDDVIVPTEDVIELVKGKRKTSARKFYPGYLLIKMDLNYETWHLVNSTAKVTGFLGTRSRPTPISDLEANEILNRMEAGKIQPQPKFFFEIGDSIKVIDGPFTNFNGIVEEINPEKGKIKVLVSIFGRSTPVFLDFVQVSKL